MSISITFYSNFQKKDNSTLIPSGSGSAYSCTLKDGCGIIDPVIEIDMGSISPTSFNYAYITSFSRYYYVQNWRYYRGLWTAQLHVDVLASFKTQIGDQALYVVRSASAYTTDLIDDQYACGSYITQTNTLLSGGFNISNGFYILGLIGDKPDTGVPSIGGVNYYYLNQTQMNDFTDYLCSQTFSNLTLNAAEGVTDAISKLIINPIEYIASCMYFPCAIDVSGATAYVQPKIGWWDTYPIYGSGSNLSPTLGGQMLSMIRKVPAMTDITFTLQPHSEVARGRYMDRAPYSEYVFHLDPFGDISIPSEYLTFGTSGTTAETLKYSVVLDLLTGKAKLTITDNAKTMVLAENYAQVGIDIQLSQMATDATGIAASLGKSIWDGFKGLFNDTIAQAGSAIISGIEAAHTNMDTLRASQGSLLPFESANQIITGPVLRTYRLTPVQIDTPTFGKPLCASRTIKTLSGFIKCAKGDHNVQAYESEKTLISNYLTGGFFYE